LGIFLFLKKEKFTINPTILHITKGDEFRADQKVKNEFNYLLTQYAIKAPAGPASEMLLPEFKKRPVL
jgi:hypothetical protein